MSMPKPEITEKRKKNSNLLKTKIILKCKLSGSPVFTFSLLGGGGSHTCLHQLYHWE